MQSRMHIPTKSNGNSEETLLTWEWITYSHETKLQWIALMLNKHSRKRTE